MVKREVFPWELAGGKTKFVEFCVLGVRLHSPLPYLLTPTATINSYLFHTRSLPEALHHLDFRPSKAIFVYPLTWHHAPRSFPSDTTVFCPMEWMNDPSLAKSPIFFNHFSKYSPHLLASRETQLFQEHIASPASSQVVAVFFAMYFIQLVLEVLSRFWCPPCNSLLFWDHFLSVLS